MKPSQQGRSNRTFQQFETSDDDELFGNLEDINRSRGEKFDQFEVNEKIFGVKSTYDNDLYTTKLDKDDEFYKLNERKAEEIEKQISLQEISNRHIAEERGIVMQQEDGDDDEEAKYSSVQKSEENVEKKKTIHSAWSQAPVIKESVSQNTSTSNSPVIIKKRKDSTGLKGRRSGSGSSSPLISSSPKSSSPLERSMKNLNLDCPSPTFSKKQKEDFTDFLQKELDLERKKVKEDLKSYKKESEKKPSSNVDNTNEREQKNETNDNDKEKKEEETFSSTLNPDAEEFTPPPMYLTPEGYISIPIPYDQYYYTGQPYYPPYVPQTMMYSQYNSNYSKDYEKKPKKNINKVYSESMERRIKKNKKNNNEYGSKTNGKSEKDWSSVVQYGKDSYKDPNTPYQQPHYNVNEYFNPMNTYPAPVFIPPGYNAPMMPYDSSQQQSYPTYPYQ